MTSCHVSEPGHGGRGAFDGDARRFLRPRDHDHVDAEVACGLDLRIGGRATGVLGDDGLDMVGAKQLALRRQIERTARGDDFDARWQWHAVRRLDQAREITVLRCCGEGAEFQPAEAQEDSARFRTERLGGGLSGRDAAPSVAGRPAPRRTADGGERQPERSAGGDRVGRDERGVGMSRVDHGADPFHEQPFAQPIDTAEAAATHRHRLGAGLACAAGERENDIEPAVAGQQPGEFGRLGGAAENKNTQRGLADGH